MSDYGFNHQGRVFTPNRSIVDAAQNDERNKEIEAAELAEWEKKPEHAHGYVTFDGGKPVLFGTWLGTPLGTIIKYSKYINRMTRSPITCITIRGSNGATYAGRFGSDWSQLCLIHRTKGK